MNLATSDCR
ncbi:unnamed protein product, partial [Rotaria sordida]